LEEKKKVKGSKKSTPRFQRESFKFGGRSREQKLTKWRGEMGGDDNRKIFLRSKGRAGPETGPQGGKRGVRLKPKKKKKKGGEN